MITSSFDRKKYHRNSWLIWSAQTFCLFITFVLGYAPALFACLILGVIMSFRDDRFSNEY